jgi:hypothetical protein
MNFDRCGSVLDHSALTIKLIHWLAKMTIKLYGFPIGQPTRSVLMLLKAANIPFEYKILNVFKGFNST